MFVEAYVPRRVSATLGKRQGRVCVRATCFLVLCLLHSTVGAQDDWSFKRYTTADGLSQSYVYSMIQDSRGFVWLGTHSEGIAILDPETGIFRVPPPPRDAGLREAAKHIQRIVCDDENSLWLITVDGTLLRYVPARKEWKRYETSLAKDAFCNALLTSTNEMLFTSASMEYSLLSRYDRVNDSIVTLFEVENVISAGSVLVGISVLTEADDKSIWFCGTRSLGKYDMKSGNVTIVSRTLPYFTVGMVQVDRNTLWIAAREGTGWTDFRTPDEITWIQSESDGSAVHTGSVCISLLKDRSGRVWVGTDRGLIVLDRSVKRFSTHEPDATQGNSISAGSIRTICLRKNGTILVSGTAGVIDLYNPLSRTWTTPEKLNAYIRKYSMVASPPINRIYEDSRANIWLIAPGAGVIVSDPTLSHFRQFAYTAVQGELLYSHV